MKQYAYGVDIGGTTVKIGFFRDHRKACRYMGDSYTHREFRRAHPA